MAEREPLDVLEAIHSTRAQRYLKSDPVSDEVVWAVLDAAVRGPTGGNGQKWAWVVIRDPATKSRIAKIYEPRLKSIYGYERISDEGLGEKRILPGGFREGDVGIDARNRRGVIHLAEHLAEAPLIVAPVVHNAATDPDTRLAGARLGSSIYGAVQNLMLAARAYDLGSVFTWTFDEPCDFNEMLGLPDDARVMCLIPMGYLARGRFSQPRRRPITEVVHWERWGEQRSRSER